jgi:hypothetical protein
MLEQEKDLHSFPKLINELDDNVIEINQEFVIQRVNASFLRHINSAGITNSPIDMKLFDVLKMASDLKHYFDEVFQSGNMIQFERKSPNPAVNKLFMITLIPMKDTAKEVIGILFMSHEIKG